MEPAGRCAPPLSAWGELTGRGRTSQHHRLTSPASTAPVTCVLGNFESAVSTLSAGAGAGAAATVVPWPLLTREGGSDVTDTCVRHSVSALRSCMRRLLIPDVDPGRS